MAGRKKCDPQADKFDICSPAGSECFINGTPDSCEGSTLIYCDDGYKTKSDCAALGFKGCGPLEAGAMRIGSLCR